MKLTLGVFMNELKFKSNGDGTCELVLPDDFAEEILYVPEKKTTVKKLFRSIRMTTKALKKFSCPLLSNPKTICYSDCTNWKR